MSNELTPIKHLSPAEIDKYQKLKEKLIEELEIISTAFARVGKILRTIRDERLYRAEFPTFEEFTKKTFSRGRDYAYKLIAAYDLVQELIEQGVPKSELPQSERLTRELSLYPNDLRVKMLHRARELALAEGKDKPESQHIREAGGELTRQGKARLVRALIEKLTGIKRTLPSSIDWSLFETHQRQEVMTLLLEIGNHAAALLKEAATPETVDVETEVQRPRSIREIQ